MTQGLFNALVFFGSLLVLVFALGVWMGRRLYFLEEAIESLRAIVQRWRGL